MSSSRRRGRALRRGRPIHWDGPQHHESNEGRSPVLALGPGRAGGLPARRGQSGLRSGSIGPRHSFTHRDDRQLSHESVKELGHRSAPNEEVDVISETFRQHRVLLSLPIVLAGLIAGFLVFTSRPSYVSTASLWVDTPTGQNSSVGSATQLAVSPWHKSKRW